MSALSDIRRLLATLGRTRQIGTTTWLRQATQDQPVLIIAPTDPVARSIGPNAISLSRLPDYVDGRNFQAVVVENATVSHLLAGAEQELAALAREREDHTAYRVKTKQQLLELDTWNRLLARDAQNLSEYQARTYEQLTATRKQLARLQAQKTIHTIRVKKR